MVFQNTGNLGLAGVPSSVIVISRASGQEFITQEPRLPLCWYEAVMYQCLCVGLRTKSEFKKGRDISYLNTGEVLGQGQ